MNLRIVSLSVVLLSVLSAGCGERPSAPALRDAPVYHSRQEGFRFLVPDGWTQNASAVLPTGPLEGESFLVRYRMKTPEQGAMLQIVCCQDSETFDPEQHHTGPSYRIDKWTLTEPSTTLDIHGVPACRMVYTATTDGRSMTKEAVCFRRHGRVYSFVGLFLSSDDKAREQVRRAVGSVIWER